MSRMKKLIAVTLMAVATIATVNVVAATQAGAAVSRRAEVSRKAYPAPDRIVRPMTLIVSQDGCETEGNSDTYVAWSVNGLVPPDSTADYFQHFVWGGNYNLNRIAVSWRLDSAHSWVVMGAAGGTSDTLNDVNPTSQVGGYVPSDWPKYAPGSHGQVRVSVWGGPGDSTASCHGKITQL